MQKVSKALTIAGLDPSGGAGVIADIKTFSALNVWGMAVITALTIQDTKGVYGITSVDSDLIVKQIEKILGDIGVDATKTGVLYTEEIVIKLSQIVEDYRLPLVVDPIIYSGTGTLLTKPETLEAMKNYLIPKAKVLTPNIPEAEVLSGIKIGSVEDMKKATKIIAERYNCEAVVIKGGHLPADKIVDVSFIDGDIHIFESRRIETKNTHGTGCTFSAAVTAEIAKGNNVLEAIKLAQEFVRIAMIYGPNIGGGIKPINHMAWLHREAERYSVVAELKKFLENLVNLEEIAGLIPEVGMNVAYALNYTMDENDIVAVPGRIRNAMGKPLFCSSPEYGASKHMASYLLTARKYNRNIRAAINIRYSDEILKKLHDMKLLVSSYDRKREPKDIKMMEGKTIPWGTEHAIMTIGRVPDVIYHLGDFGKEPMIVILSENLDKLYNILKNLLNTKSKQK